MPVLHCKNKNCDAEITVKEKKLNAGLCDNCFQQGIAATARDIARKFGLG